MSASSTKREAAEEARLEAERERIKAASRVPFPAAGEGAFCHFNVKDLIDLEVALKDHTSRDETFFATAERLLLGGFPKPLGDAVDIALKVEGPDGKPIHMKVDLDDPPFMLGEAAEPILNALSWQMFRRSYPEMIADVQARLDEAMATVKESANE